MKKLLLLIVIGCLNTACEEVIQLDLPTETPRLAIEASLEMIPEFLGAHGFMFPCLSASMVI